MIRLHSRKHVMHLSLKQQTDITILLVQITVESIKLLIKKYSMLAETFLAQVVMDQMF